ncbi:MAG: hypothetical protein KA712_08220 [Myxococcales bacterium]|nr:hypothetical protein [Myxococcales bacterium]
MNVPVVSPPSDTLKPALALVETSPPGRKGLRSETKRPAPSALGLEPHWVQVIESATD